MVSLSVLRQHLATVKISSLANLCILFDCDAGLLRQMLTHWVRKGCVRCFTRTSACGGSCQQCAPPAVEIYEWILTT